jgi:hypothetical protein
MILPTRKQENPRKIRLPLLNQRPNLGKPGKRTKPQSLSNPLHLGKGWLQRRKKSRLLFCESIKFLIVLYYAKNLTSWAKPKYHTHTDQLLTIIEESPRYRQAFGFSKEPGTNPTTGGKTLGDLYTEVASELLLADLSDLDLNFTHDNLPILQNVISNRISS